MGHLPGQFDLQCVRDSLYCCWYCSAYQERCHENHRQVLWPDAPVLVSSRCSSKDSKKGWKWYEVLTGDAMHRWQSLVWDLQEAPDFTIPRFHLRDVDTYVTSCSLHSFCDTPLGAYATVIFLVAWNPVSNVWGLSPQRYESPHINPWWLLISSCFLHCCWLDSWIRLQRICHKRCLLSNSGAYLGGGGVLWVL